jgi:hypothetical protein
MVMLKLFASVAFLLSGGFWFYSYFWGNPGLRRILGGTAFVSLVFTFIPLFIEMDLGARLPSSKSSNIGGSDADVNKRLRDLENRVESFVRPTEPDALQTPRLNRSANLVALVQSALRSKKCYSGPSDGIVGRRTRSAIQDFNRVNTANIDADSLKQSDVEIIRSDASFACGENLSSELNCFSFNGRTVCE